MNLLPEPPSFTDPDYYECGEDNHQWKKVGENSDGDRFYRCVTCGKEDEA